MPEGDNLAGQGPQGDALLARARLQHISAPFQNFADAFRRWKRPERWVDQSSQALREPRLRRITFKMARSPEEVAR